MSNKFEFKKFVGTDGFVITADNGAYAEANIYIGNVCVYVGKDNAAVLLELSRAFQAAYDAMTTEDE